MFESLRSRMAFDAIRKWLTAHHRTRKTHTLETASSIAVLFDATREKTRTETLAWIKDLKNSGKNVAALGFFNEKKPPESIPNFDFYNAKALNWTLETQSDKAKSFADATNDLLICINPDELAAISWVAAKSKAAMKIGMATHHHNDFDLQIDTPPEKGVHFFAAQLQFYLGKIKTP